MSIKSVVLYATIWFLMKTIDVLVWIHTLLEKLFHKIVNYLEEE